MESDVQFVVRGEALRSRARRSWAALATPSGVHYAALSVTAVVLLVASSSAWFFYDDWALLVPSLPNIWAPHGGHWSTTPYLIFSGLRNVFGLNSYLPFAIPVIIAQLALAHLIWGFCLKIGMSPWIATTLGLVLMFFGAGSENVLWAFQVGFVGAMALAMGVVMILLKDRVRLPEVVMIIALSTIALSSSGSAIPVLMAAALLGWSRHGFRRTVTWFAVPAAAYLVWFAIIGRTAPPSGRATGLTQTLYGIPTFAISMLTDGLGRALPIAVFGSLIFVAVAVWGVLSYGRASPIARPAYVLFLAAPIFALVTGYSRVDLGILTATSSRYLFFIIPMMLPLIGLALDAAVRRANLPVGAIVALLLVIVVYNAGGLVGPLITRDSRAMNSRELLSAAASLESSYPDAASESRPGGTWAPDIRLSDLDVFVAKGWFTPGHFGEVAMLSARATLGVVSAPAAAPATQVDCPSLPTDGSPTVFPGHDILIEAAIPSTISVSLVEGGASGNPVSVVVPRGWSTISVVGDTPARMHLVLSSTNRDLTACLP